MESLFPARFLTFDHESWTQPTSLRYAAELVRDGKVAAVLLDVVPEDALRAWWLDSSPTGETSSAARASLFTQLFVDEMRAERQTFSGWNRFMMAVKHAYPVTQLLDVLATGGAGLPTPSLGQRGLASAWGQEGDDDTDNGAAPVVDARMLSAGVEQLAAFVTIRPGTHSPGIRLWNRRSAPIDARNPWSQPANRGPQLAAYPVASEGAAPLTIRPTAGQLCLFNSANQHAWETSGLSGMARARAASPRVPAPRSTPGATRSSVAAGRLTIYSFLVHHQDGWTLLH